MPLSFPDYNNTPAIMKWLFEKYADRHPEVVALLSETDERSFRHKLRRAVRGITDRRLANAITGAERARAAILTAKHGAISGSWGVGYLKDQHTSLIEGQARWNPLHARLTRASGVFPPQPGMTPGNYREWLFSRLRTGDREVARTLSDPRDRRALERGLEAEYGASGSWRRRILHYPQNPNLGPFRRGGQWYRREGFGGVDYSRTARQLVPMAQEWERHFANRGMQSSRSVAPLAGQTRPERTRMIEVTTRGPGYRRGYYTRTMSPTGFDSYEERDAGQHLKMDPWRELMEFVHMERGERTPGPRRGGAFNRPLPSEPTQGKERTGPFWDYYSRRMKSPEWEAKRQEALTTHGHSCAIAGCRSTNVDLHHVTYDRFGNERMDDLMPLCSRHHKTLHRYLERRGLQVEFSGQVIRNFNEARKERGPGPGGRNLQLRHYGGSEYLDIPIPFGIFKENRRTGRKARTVAELPPYYLAMLQQDEEWMRDHENANIRQFYQTFQHIKRQRWYQESVRDYHGTETNRGTPLAEGRYSPADTDIYRHDYSEFGRTGGGKPRPRRRDPSGWMEGKGVEYAGDRPSHRIIAGTRRRWLGDDTFITEDHMVTNWRLRKMESRVDRPGRDIDPEAHEQQVRADFWEMVGGRPAEIRKSYRNRRTRQWRESATYGVVGGYRGVDEYRDEEGKMKLKFYFGGLRGLLEGGLQRLREKGMHEWIEDYRRAFYQRALEEYGGLADQIVVSDYVQERISRGMLFGYDPMRASKMPASALDPPWWQEGDPFSGAADWDFRGPRGHSRPRAGRTRRDLPDDEEMGKALAYEEEHGLPRGSSFGTQEIPESEKLIDRVIKAGSREELEEILADQKHIDLIREEVPSLDEVIRWKRNLHGWEQ